MKNHEELPIKHSDYEKVLHGTFKLNAFRVGQKEIIVSVLNKTDTMAVLPTGGGKSLCFQFPAVYTKRLVIVISPLIALMKDQVRILNAQGLRAGCLYSGQGDDEKRQIFNDINQGGPYLLYLSPERVQKEGFQKWILDREISLFAIDEAHCVSQWGHDFRNEYSQLSILKKLRPDVPVLALTASATPIVIDDIIVQLGLQKPQRFVRGFYRDNLYYQVELCDHEDSKKDWLKQAIKQYPDGRIIVYCGTRKITEEIAYFLSQHFEKVGFYHAGLNNLKRTSQQSKYDSGEYRILVATNAFGMGIDQPNVRLVIHYQMPANIDALCQEMGRAGRDGNISTCLMLYSKKDKGLQSFFIQSSEAAKNIKDLKWRNLDALVEYCESSECRHAEILTYYKDSYRLRKCGHCDVCDAKSSRKISQPVRTTVSEVSSKKKKNVYDDQHQLTIEQQKRFEGLKAWRKIKAQELDSPAFVIFGDKTLREVAINNPQSLEELKSIYGFGEVKIEKFGPEVLTQIKQESF
ncbi:MAG: RecQ family ATP-dependent DNA helicase [Pseudobdellovibrio sp.]